MLAAMVIANREHGSVGHVRQLSADDAGMACLQRACDGCISGVLLFAEVATCAACCALLKSRHAMTTCQSPVCARARAADKPRPEDAPVMMTCTYSQNVSIAGRRYRTCVLPGVYARQSHEMK